MVHTKIVKIGDRYLMLLDPAILKALKIHPSTPLRMEVDGDKLVITPVRGERKKCKDPELQKLLDEALEEYAEALQKLADN